jgi:uncharacterized protein (UPF0335 family)
MKLIAKRSLPELKQELYELEDELTAMKASVADIQRNIAAKMFMVDRLKLMVKRRENPNSIMVSDHAIVRYLERVKGIDRHEIECEILSEDVIDLIDKLGGNGSYPNKAGFVVCMKQGTVTTIKK